MVLLDRLPLLVDALLLGLEDLELLVLALDLTLALLALVSQLVDVLVAIAHHFRVVVKESGVGDKTLLELVIFLTELVLTCLELELLLSELLLFGDVGLLVFVHPAALVQKTRGWGHCVKLLLCHKLLFVLHNYSFLLVKIFKL